MPHRLHLRLAIVSHLEEENAIREEAAHDPRSFHVSQGVRETDYDQAITELIGLEILAARADGCVYITPAGRMVVHEPFGS